jgi:hypothetical protein
MFTSCEQEKKTTLKEYSVEKRHILPETIQETSGIIRYNNLIWTFNDSGGKPEIYGFNLSNDSIAQTIRVKDAINEDWEDIAQDENYIYLGDFGNNQGARDSLVVYKIAKAAIPQHGNASVTSEKIVFSYPGYEPVKVPTSWSAFDCEAFVVSKETLFLFSKDWTNGTSTVYSLPAKAGKYQAKKLNKWNTEGLVTGADLQDNKLILIGYSSFVPFIVQFPAGDVRSISYKSGKRYDLTELSTYQTEGICYDGKNILISSEKTRSPAQIIELKLN